MDDQSCHRTTKTEKTKTTPEERLKEEAAKEEKIKESGQLELTNNQEDHILYLLSIIGEIEGHECLSSNAKTTKYEHVLPKLAEIEDSRRIEGVLIILNTVGGDVESGLAIAEMDRFAQQTDRVAGAWRQSFDRSAACGFNRLFLYRSVRNNGHSSGADERDGDRSAADLRLF